jgi:tetratricopeptide (TPR) repeat protein/DNA-binding transcriptional MerR regulator
MNPDDTPLHSRKIINSETEITSSLNIPVLLARADTRASGLREPLPLGELINLLGPNVNRGKIQYWSELGILRPKRKKKAKIRDFNYFNRDEIARAFVTTQLLEQGWELEEIKSLLVLKDAGKLPSGPATPYSELDQTGRAAVLVRARLLSIITSLAYGTTEVPRDCQIIIRKVKTPSDAKSRIQFSKTTDQEVIDMLEEPGTILGWSDATESRELNTFFRIPEKFHSKLSGRIFYKLIIKDDIKGDEFEIILGIKDDHSDQDVYQLKNRLELGFNNTLTRDQHSLLLRLFYFMFDVVLNLEEILVDTRYAFRLSKIEDITTAIVNAISLASLEKWEYAALLVPDGKNNLRVTSFSGMFPRDVRERNYSLEVLNNGVASLAGWVYVNKDDIVIEKVELDDPRLPQSDRFLETGTALAFIPAVVQDKVQGVLLVGGKRRVSSGYKCFDRVDVMMLYILGRIVGESYQRAQLARCNDFLGYPPQYDPLISKELDEYDLQNSLEDVAKMIRPVVQAGIGYETNIFLLAVRIIGGSVPITTSSEILDWFLDKVQRHIHMFIKKNGDDIWNTELGSRIYRVQKDKGGEIRLVGLIGRTRINPDEFRGKFLEILDSLRHLIHIFNAQIYGWLVPFTYKELSERFDLSLSNREKLTRVANHLVERVNGALDVLVHVSKGDKKRRERDFYGALLEYREAYDIDKENPYILRHLVDCYIELEKYEDAIDKAKEAVAKDPVAASYHRLANAFAEAGAFDDAKENYQEAIRITPYDAELHRLYAHLLFLKGVTLQDKKSLELAIQHYTSAKEYDISNNLKQAFYYRYIAEASMLIPDLKIAEHWMQKSLELAPGDSDLEWRLRQFRHGIRLCKSTS